MALSKFLFLPQVLWHQDHSLHFLGFQVYCRPLATFPHFHSASSRPLTILVQVHRALHFRYLDPKRPSNELAKIYNVSKIHNKYSYVETWKYMNFFIYHIFNIYEYPAQRYTMFSKIYNRYLYIENDM